ncbi:hypothetical protein OG884_10270 [Streptosporangium sp. NBC_01755]|uniref:hypothetical protein n=1 Tax=unclassified Streptosporangium TaxID=2632669 RepID=UPI002DDA180F|nr:MULTISPECIES: hypothetical protein [unclassified Streptosporangium]WSA26308.1 hypothetical protein OIE13_36410 [Streptosporangium sp. NBC_01810]WSD02264.1 hypothetical protein OG884_10270 [Streptosporangium sp. NBC_01755]
MGSGIGERGVVGPGGDVHRRLQEAAAAQVPWFVTQARACARVLEVLLLPPAERRRHS